MNNLTRTLVLCSALMLTACAEDDPQQFIEEGSALFEKGEVKGAQVQFKNALQINPKLHEAYYGLALIAEKTHDWEAMKSFLREVVVLDPKHVGAHVKLGFLLIGQPDKAKEHALIALELDPENIDALLLKGRISFYEEQYSEAQKQLDLVLEKEPRKAGAIWLQASIFMAEKRYDEMLTTLNLGIKNHPNNIDLGLLKVKLFKEQKKNDEVIAVYDDLVEKHPGDQTLRYARIKILARYGKPGQAEEALRQAISQDPENNGLMLSLVDNVERRDVAEAEVLLKGYLNASPQNIKLKTRLAGFYIGHKRVPEAKTILNEIMEVDLTGKDGLMAKVRLAEILWDEGEHKTAENLVNEVLQVDMGNSAALLFRAALRFKQRDADGVIADLRIVLRDQPNSDRVMVMMAQAHAMKGESEMAESYWRKALEVTPGNVDAVKSLVDVFLKRGDAAGAESLLVKSNKAAPSSVIKELLVRVKAGRKDWAGAGKVLNEMKKQPQNAVVVQMLSGMLANDQGHYQEAIQAYKNVLKIKPDALPAFTELARSYRAIGKQRGGFIVFLESFIQERPQSIVAYSLLGQAYGAEKKWDAAEAILKKSLDIEPKAVMTYRMLAAIYARQGQVGKAIKLYRKGLGVLPSDERLMLELAGYYEIGKDFDSAISTYRELLKINPENDLAANNLANILLKHGKGGGDLERVVSLVERFNNSTDPYFLDTYGWVMFKSGGVEKAVDSLRKVVEMAPDVAIFRYHLGEVYYAAGIQDASKVELERFVVLAKKNSEVSEVARAKKLLGEME